MLKSSFMLWFWVGVVLARTSSRAGSSFNSSGAEPRFQLVFQTSRAEPHVRPSLARLVPSSKAAVATPYQSHPFSRVQPPFSFLMPRKPSTLSFPLLHPRAPQAPTGESPTNTQPREEGASSGTQSQPSASPTKPSLPHSHNQPTDVKPTVILCHHPQNPLIGKSDGGEEHRGKGEDRRIDDDQGTTTSTKEPGGNGKSKERTTTTTITTDIFSPKPTKPGNHHPFPPLPSLFLPNPEPPHVSQPRTCNTNHRTLAIFHHRA